MCLRGQRECLNMEGRAGEGRAGAGGARWGGGAVVCSVRNALQPVRRLAYRALDWNFIQMSIKRPRLFKENAGGVDSIVASVSPPRRAAGDLSARPFLPHHSRRGRRAVGLCPVLVFWRSVCTRVSTRPPGWRRYPQLAVELFRSPFSVFGRERPATALNGWGCPQRAQRTRRRSTA